MFLGIDFINKYAYHLLHNNIDSITMIFDNDNVIEFGIDIIILWMYFVSFFFYTKLFSLHHYFKEILGDRKRLEININLRGYVKYILNS